MQATEVKRGVKFKSPVHVEKWYDQYDGNGRISVLHIPEEKKLKIYTWIKIDVQINGICKKILNKKPTVISLTITNKNKIAIRTTEYNKKKRQSWTRTTYSISLIEFKNKVAANYSLGLLLAHPGNNISTVYINRFLDLYDLGQSLPVPANNVNDTISRIALVNYPSLRGINKDRVGDVYSFCISQNKKNRKKSLRSLRAGRPIKDIVCNILGIKAVNKKLWNCILDNLVMHNHYALRQDDKVLFQFMDKYHKGNIDKMSNDITEFLSCSNNRRYCIRNRTELLSLDSRLDKIVYKTIMSDPAYNLASDTLNMLMNIIRLDPSKVEEILDIYNKDLLMFHDRLTVLHHNVRHPIVDLPVPESFLPLQGMEINGYKIIVPIKSDELHKVGAKLHNCVGSYVNYIVDGTTSVVYITKDDIPVYCVEIQNGIIRQFMADYNHPITEEDKDGFTVMTFIKDHFSLYRDKNSLTEGQVEDQIFENLMVQDGENIEF